MIGGLIQLITTGIQDAPLTNNPEITFFKLVYKQYTNFSILQNIKNLGNKNFNTLNSYKIENYGDLLKSLYYTLKIPKFLIIKKTNDSKIISKKYDINKLLIIYSNFNSYIFDTNNNYTIIPEYLFNNFNNLVNLSNLDSNMVIQNLIPEIIKINDLPLFFNIIQLNESIVNPIISFLYRYLNFFEMYFCKIVCDTKDFQFNNQLITQYSYTNKLNNKINDFLFTNYNYFNNLRDNKIYYNLYEVERYLNYLNNDIKFITPSNFDMDIIYNYCIQNNISNYLDYQLNGLNYNSLFIYNIIQILYPSNLISFTFFKKYLLQTNNIPNTTYDINFNNSYNEWTNNLNKFFDPLIISSKLQIFEIYKKNYSITQNKINLLFNSLNIINPTNLYIILSTFINKYDMVTTQVNFDDYNQTSSLITLLNESIFEQVNNYSSLIKLNSTITSNSESKNNTIYPVDLMLIYPYLAYKLVEKIISLAYFNDNIFLIYWRNKINNFYFINYIQNKNNNDVNNDLYDSLELERRMTFYINLSMNKLLFLNQIKKYFLELFYSTSFFGSINISSNDYSNLKNNINVVDFKKYNDTPFDINSLNNLVNFTINNSYKIDTFKYISNQIIINNWYNNNKVNTNYNVMNIRTNIIYNVDSFTLDNTTLTLNFINPINLTDETSFKLTELHSLDLPIINFKSSTKIISNDVNIINLYKVIDSIIVNDNIDSSYFFNVSDFDFTCTNVLSNYFTYLKILTINSNNNIYRYIVDIQNNQNTYNITSNYNIEFNKDSITEVNIEFVNFIYRDIITIDSNTIINNSFPIPQISNWEYDANKTYWLVLNNRYILLKYDNGNFIVYDNLIEGLYYIREIDNSYIPSLYNYSNFYLNTNKVSDMFDFFLQSPFIFLAETDINYSFPYLFIYNLPFNSNTTTKYFINNYEVNLIIPLNTNQFFEKKISPIFNNEVIKSNSSHNLIDSMINLFDVEFSDPNYINIIEVLEKSQTELLNLNLNTLNDKNIFGSTSLEIINNIKELNNFDLTKYNNDDYNLYNKLCLNIYNNNSVVTSNSIIQGITYNIYNIPLLTYTSSSKINSKLSTYLSSIQSYYNEQLNYVNINADYLLISNKNQYEQDYNNIPDFKMNIQNTFFNSDQYNYNTLFMIVTDNLDSIYYNGNKLTSSIISSNKFSSPFIDNIINYDTNIDVSIVEFSDDTFNINKFNFISAIYLDSSTIINFNNAINYDEYNYVLFDDHKIYSVIRSFPEIVINKINRFGFLYKLTENNIKQSFTFYGTIYYYKIKLNLNNILINDFGNIIYNKNSFFFSVFDNDNNIIEIASTNIFDYTNTSFFISTIEPNNINDLLNYSFTSLIDFNVIKVNSMDVLESCIFTHYTTDNISNNNFLVNNVFQPIIKTINNFTFIYSDSMIDIDLKYYNYSYKKIPPFKINKSFNIISNEQYTIFNKYKDTSYIKLDKYILLVEDLNNGILIENNYQLFILPKTNLNLIEVNVSGNIDIIGNNIIINFDSTDGLILYSYYLINNRYIYLESVNTQVIIIDNNINYYNIGNFNLIYLLSDEYFNKIIPLSKEINNLELIDNFLENTISGNINLIRDEYVLQSIMYNRNLVINSYTDTIIKFLGGDEMKVEIGLYDTNKKHFIRPIILKNNTPGIKPIPTFRYTYNSTIYIDSLIIINNIPRINEDFVKLDISFYDKINSLESLNPSINIFSNKNFTSNTISFNNNQNIFYNTFYLFKLLVNNIYPLYFWVYISNSKFIYTSVNVSEPVYITPSQTNIILTINNNIQFLEALPQIISISNKKLILSNFFYNNYPRVLQSQYYLNNIYKDNGSIQILDYNFEKSIKQVPKLKLLERINIKSFNSSFVYLDSSIINIIKNAVFLILFNNENYYYINNINTEADGFYLNIINQNAIDITKELTIYYSFNELHFNKNNFILFKDQNFNFKIKAFDYNDFHMNELILINENIFLVLGLNTMNNEYDLQLMNTVYSKINSKIRGYYSLGIIGSKAEFTFQKTLNKPLIYNQDSSVLNFGDYYFKNNNLLIFNKPELIPDIFSFGEKGNNYKLICYNNKFYQFNNFDRLSILDNLYYNNQIYKIKVINNHEIIFFNNVNFIDGIYIFYCPNQPFIISNIYVNNLGKVTASDNVENHLFLNSDLVEIDFIFYKVLDQNILNLPDIYFNRNLLIRYYRFDNSKVYFNNEIYIKYPNVTNNICIKANSTIVDSTSVSVELNFIINNYFYYLQPIKINSTINYISNLIYRDTTIFIQLLNNIKITGSVVISFTPLVLYLEKSFSILNVENYQHPIDQTVINNIHYSLDKNQLVNVILTNQSEINNNQIEGNFINNYVPLINYDFEINSYHLILELTQKNEYIIHYVQILYPNKLKFFTKVLYETSTFYLDKIYPIVIDFINLNYTFDLIIYFKLNTLLDINKNEIIIWYKYPIKTIGIPINENNKFKLQIDNGSNFINKDIFLTKNITNPLTIKLENSNYYLISNNYLGNDVSFIYLYEKNYIQDYKMINSTWKSEYTNHSDTNILNFFDFDNTNIYNEKIVIPVIVKLLTIGDYYKYEIFSIDNNLLQLDPNLNYYIDNLYLKIEQTYVYDNQSIIFTKTVIGSNKTININIQTQLFLLNSIDVDYFDKIRLSKTIPELVNKVNTNMKIRPDMIFNCLKTWDSWSILSFYNNSKIITFLNKGKVVLNSTDTSNIYFTNDEVIYLTSLLEFINTDINEYNKIKIQQNIFNDLIYELNLWLNDCSFWEDVQTRINLFLQDYDYKNVNFNGNCLIFDDEIGNFDVYFDNSFNPNTRKYTLNNQYILEDSKTISRNMNLIITEVYNFTNNIENHSYYGIELNSLLKYLSELSIKYKKICKDIYYIDDNEYTYFSGIKLIINNIWINYKNQLNKLNQDFNKVLTIQNNESINNNSELKKYYYFANDFTLNIVNTLPYNENFIYETKYYDNNFFVINNNNFSIISNNIFPYYLSYEEDLILPNILYKINFINQKIDQILNFDSYSFELDFYLLNNLSTKIDFTLIGTSNYNVTSKLLGQLYNVTIMESLGLTYISNVNYKNTNVQLYISNNIQPFVSNINLHIISPILLESHNILEISYYIGLKEQNTVYLKFYNNNFNYIQHKTYIKIESTLILLNLDTTLGYYLDKYVPILVEIVEIINLINVVSVEKLNNYVYDLILDNEFTYYNNYINDDNTIIPTNFKLNNIINPIDINIRNNTNFYAITNQIYDISNISHYINIGETIPNQVSSISKNNTILYQTNIFVNLITNSHIYMYDISNSYLCNTTNLDQTYLKFTIDQNFSNEELKNKNIRNDNIWLINDYSYNPNTKLLIFSYPNLLDFKNTEQYVYYINGIIIDTLSIQIGSQKITIQLLFDIDFLQPITFKQIHYLNTVIYKPLICQLAQIILKSDYDFSHYTNLYLEGYDNYGLQIGKNLYKIVLNSQITNDIIKLYSSSIYLMSYTEFESNIFYKIDDYTIIIGCDTNLDLNIDYFLVINKNIVLRINTITYYQQLLQDLIFYKQDDTKTLNVFCNEELNEYALSNQIFNTKYFISGKHTGINLVNIIDTRNITKADSMNITIVKEIDTNVQYIKPQLKLPIFWINKTDFCIGDQVIESLNSDTMAVTYNVYLTEEKRKQTSKIVNIKETKDYWIGIIPLDFWFSRESTLSIPMLSLPYIDLLLNYRIENINNLILNDMTNCTLSQIPQIKVELNIDSIILDTTERELFGSTQHEYLIERYKIYPSSLVFNTSQLILYKFYNLVKDIVFITQPIYHQNDTYYMNITKERDIFYKEYYDLNIMYNSWLETRVFTDKIPITNLNNFLIIESINSEILVGSERINKLKVNKYLSRYDLKFCLYLMDKYLTNHQLKNQIYKLTLYFSNNYKDIEKIKKISPITKFNIKNNGNDFFTKQDYNYFNSLIPCTKFKSSPDIGYYVYSFSLLPSELQPSGHLNFNFLDNVELDIDSSDMVKSEPYNLKVIVKEYQIIRIMSGIGSLAWLN
jgi:hypothetical protein